MANPIRILHVLPSLDERYGGPLRLVLDLSAATAGPGFASEVLGVGPIELRDNPLPAEAIHSIEGRPGAYAYSPALGPWLRANLNRYQALVIHGAWTYPGWVTAQAARAAGIPYGYFPHGMLEQWAVWGQGWIKRAKKLLYWQWREQSVVNGAARVFFTTRLEQDRSRPLTGPLGHAEILRPYGMLPAAPAAEPANPGLRLDPGLTVGLFLGRLHPKKNVELLLEAWSAAGMPPEARLVIAGGGEAAYEAQLRKRAAELPQMGNVIFTGFVAGADKDYLLSRADWFLLPSRQENFGVAVLEAISRGCAVAISEQVYLCESFRPESAVLPVDQAAWTRFLTDRFSDREWRNQTRDRDREHLAAEYAEARILRQWRSALEDLARRGSRP